VDQFPFVDTVFENREVLLWQSAPQCKHLRQRLGCEATADGKSAVLSVRAEIT